MAAAVTSRAAHEHFARSVVPRLDALRRKVRGLVLLQGCLHLGLVALGCFGIQLLVDYGLHLRVDLRAALLAVVLLTLAATLWRTVLTPWRKPVDVADIAQVLEQRFPHLQSRLISAIEFSDPLPRDPAIHSEALVRHMLAQTERLAGELPMDAILNRQQARRQAGLCCIVLAIPVLLSVFAQETMGTWFERNILLGEARWGQATHLILLNDDDRDGLIQAPRGDDLVIRVKAVGRRPRHLRIDMQFDTGSREGQLMTAVGSDEFRFTIPRISQGLVLGLRGGDDRVDGVRVALVDRPRVSEAQVRVYPPAYTAEPPYDLRSGKSLIEVLPGSEVEIDIVVNKPVAQATLVCDQQDIAPAQPQAAGFSTRFAPQHDATCSFALLDANGLANTVRRQFVVRLVPDAPPVVELNVPGAGEVLTPQAQLQLALQFKDRYGLAEAAVVYRLGDAAAEDHRLPADDLNPGATQLATTLALRLPELGAEEGQRLTLQGEARDANNISGPGIGTSAQYSYRIVSAEALLAELGRREQEFQQEFGRLVNSQEQLRNDLLSAATLAARNPDARDPLRDLMAAAERRQRQLARQTGHVRGQFQRIFDELALNQLDTPQVRKRLIVGIVRPLDALAARALTEAADDIARFEDPQRSVSFANLDHTQQALLQEMQRILNQMARWEGFHETLGLLQAVIDMQRQLKEETDRTLHHQLDDIFGTEDKQ